MIKEYLCIKSYIDAPFTDSVKYEYFTKGKVYKCDEVLNGDVCLINNYDERHWMIGLIDTNDWVNSFKAIKNK